MKQLIKNSLVKCNITELDEIIRSDNQIKELLFTPCERLPEKYLNLIDVPNSKEILQYLMKIYKEVQYNN